ncbi:hypothetical protein DL762_000858 [Monosporascus cannonballus]|uniref:Allergen Asp f 4 n=1 Tax=Monosporascus cannonballus TaxID=155416 RepID=A0ABY0HI22_9PEZI|nr:hypothetical protein DL762_000858 [Monosporascus cannonballus]
MHINNSLLLLAAMGASNVAGRATHRHRHADLHHKARNVGDIVHATIDGKMVSWINTYDGSNEGGESPAEAPAPAAEPSASPEAEVKPAIYQAEEVKSSAPVSATSYPSAPAPTESSSSDESGESDDSDASDDSVDDADVVSTYTPFCKAANKRATAAQIAYTGNVGSKWGCNQMLVSKDIADKYDYKIKVVGQNKEPWKVVCTNKIGPTGKIDGWYNGNHAVEFMLKPGATQYIAVDKNTQGICAAAPGDSIPVDEFGGYASTWFEFDFANESNNGWSGADISVIQAEAAGFKAQGMRTCHADICSTVFDGPAGRVVDNAFDFAARWEDGIGLNIAPGPCEIEYIVGYSD